MKFDTKGSQAKALVGLSLVLAGCNITSFACGPAQHCSSNVHGKVLGGDEEDRERALKELSRAATVYRLWTGENAPIGTIILDNDISAAWPTTWGSKWHFHFDVRMLEHPIQMMPSDKNGLTPIEADSGSDKTTYIDGDLAHEVCHRYVDNIAATISGRHPIPDLIKEAAAISCETSASRRDRLSGAGGGERPFASEAVDTLQHPLSDFDIALKDAGLPAGDELPRSFSFEMNAEAPLSQDIVNFYYQSVILQDVLRRDRRRGLRTLGSLIVASAKGQRFADWLDKNPAGSDLPRDASEFAAYANSRVNAGAQSASVR